MELFQRGIITKEDTDGLELTWGNHQVVLELVRKIAKREGFGKLLGEGTKRAAEAIGKGAEKYAMHSKGLELPAYDPRAAKVHGLSMATSNTVGATCTVMRDRKYRVREVPDRLTDSHEGKGDIAAYNQVAKALEETGVLCNFADSGMTYELLGKLYAAATGHEQFRDESYLRLVGERIVCLERCFNLREGFSRKDDALPVRMTTEPLTNAGPATGQVVRILDALFDGYYDSLGYSRDGVPTRENSNSSDLRPL